MNHRLVILIYFSAYPIEGASGCINILEGSTFITPRPNLLSSSKMLRGGQRYYLPIPPKACNERLILHNTCK